MLDSCIVYNQLKRESFCDMLPSCTAVHVRPAWASAARELLFTAHVLDRICRVTSPCVGLNAPYRAAAEMEFTAWRSNNVYDLVEILREDLERLEPHVPLHLGPMDGDITAVNVAELDDAEGLVSGPPCPPASTMGPRMEEQDSRARVFETVLAWLQELASRQCLRWFVLENVEGILKRKRASEGSYGQRLVSRMLGVLPRGWKVELWVENSLLHGVAQSRTRVFFVGTSPWMRRTPLQRRLLRQGPQRHVQLNLSEFLEHVKRDEDYEALSFRQKLNVDWHCDSWWAQEREFPGVVDISRDPTKKIDSQIVINRVQTLRTNNARLWLFPSSALKHAIGARGRLLTIVEKARLSGLTDNALDGLLKKDLAHAETAVGNTIPIPMMGHILAPVLRMWQEGLRADMFELSP